MVKRRRETTSCSAPEKLSGNGMASGTASGVDVSQAGKGANGEERCGSELVAERSPPEIASSLQQPTPVVQTNNVVLRSSTRPTKRPRRDNSPPSNSATSSKSSVSYKPSPSGNSTKSGNNIKSKKALKNLKVKRWRWTVLDSNLFYEALYQHGKNFDLVHKFIEQRHKKRGVPTSLTKEQVRHLYYRILHKISKYFPQKDEDQKKIHQEICGLINYGELKKKLKGPLDEKKGRKLTELIATGATTIRWKGKNLKIRTPCCKALKMLNNTEGGDEDLPLKLPAKLVVELQPRNNLTWSMVQGMAQNPRLRLLVPLKKEVSHLLEFLSDKWMPHRLKLLKSLVPVQEEEEPASLQLWPARGVEVTPYHSLTGKYVHKGSQKTLRYGKDRPAPPNPPAGGAKSASSSPTALGKNKAAAQAAKSASGKGAGGASPPADKCEKCGRIKSGSEQWSSACSGAGGPPTCICVNIVLKGRDGGAAVQTERAEGPGGGGGCPATDKFGARNAADGGGKSSQGLEGEGRGAEGPEAAVPDGVAQKRAEGGAEDLVPENSWIREGLSLKTAGQITFTDLYLMHGMPDKINFEYEWQKKTPPAENNTESSSFQPSSIFEKLIYLAKTEFSGKSRQSSSSQSSSLARSLPTNSMANKTLNSNRNHSAAKSTQSEATTATVVAGRAPVGPGPAASRVVVGQGGRVGEPGASPHSQRGVFAVPTAIPATSSHRAVPRPTQQQQQQAQQQTQQQTQQEKVFIRQMESLNSQPNYVLPKSSRRMANRRTRRPLVVQRTLLPRPNGPGPTRHMMSMSIVTNTPQANMLKSANFTPIPPHTSPTSTETSSSSTATTATTTNAGPASQVSSQPLTLTVPSLSRQQFSIDPILLAARLAGVSTSPLKSASSPLKLALSSPLKLPPSPLKQAPSPVFVRGTTGATTQSAQPPSAAAITTTATALPAAASFTTATITRPLVTAAVEAPPQSSSSSTVTTQSAAVASVEGPPFSPTTRLSPSKHLSVITTADKGQPQPAQSLPAGLQTPPRPIGGGGVGGGLDMSPSTSNVWSHLLQDNSNLLPAATAGDAFIDPIMTSTSFAGFGSQPHGLVSPSCSPFKINSPGPDSQWLNGESADMSLTSLLNSLESPEKKDKPGGATQHPASGGPGHGLLQAGSSSSGAGLILPPSLISESSRDSLLGKHNMDVDATLMCMINESSVDYISKFEDLAAQISSTDSTTTDNQTSMLDSNSSNSNKTD